jgi:glycosyltransferase 2 family protein
MEQPRVNGDHAPAGGLQPAPQAATEPAEASGGSFFKRRAAATVASLLLAGALVWILNAGGLPLVPAEGALAKLDQSYVAGFVLLMAVHMFTRFARYHFLIAPLARLPMRRILTINAIALALITFLPLRIGEVARPAMLRKKGQLSAWAVTGTVGAERVVDGVVFSAILLAGLAIAAPHEPMPSHIGNLPIPATLVTGGATIASLVFGSAFVVMAGFYWFRVRASQLTERVVGVVSPRFAKRLAEILGRLSDGLKFLVEPRYSLPYLGVTLISIASQAWSIEVLAHAVGIPELTFAQALVVLGLVALGFGMPNAPGFFGTVQLALYAGLAAYIAPAKVAREGATFVFVFYVVYLAIIVLMAAVSLVVEYLAPTAQTAATESVP